MISDAAIDELKQRNPCDQVAAQWVTLRRGGKLGMVGPCPLHSPDPNARDSTSFECNAEGWVCASCADGGDVIKLTALRHGLHPRDDFRRILELLGGVAEVDAERAAELAREREVRANRKAQEANIFRENERRAAFDIWHAGRLFLGTPVEDYLKLRGMVALPERLKLRFAPAAAFFHGQEENEVGRKARRVIFRGPAMLAPIVDGGGKFRAIHMTWLDLARPSGKAEIRDPDSGDPLPAKKVRGSKAGNVIPLAEALGEAKRWIMGEGIETVLSVWFAYAVAPRNEAREAFRRETAFRAAVDLGNIGGRAAATVTHPTLTGDSGRPRRVPGPQPDPAAPAIALPDSVDDLVLLGDGDSDRFTTQCALARAGARYARPGRTVRVAWAPEGMDFNNLLRGAAGAAP